MPNKVIKNHQVIEDTWTLVKKEDSEIPDGAVIVPLKCWIEQKAQLSDHKPLGLWLDADESPKAIAESVHTFDVIAINFPVFADGRGFSYARELREQYGYKGEIRAIGQFIRDQLFYLQRCGFNAFALEGTDQEPALASLSDFSDSYQASVDQPIPLFRRR